MPVNVERVQLLVDALRSDRFKQGYGALEKTQSRLNAETGLWEDVVVDCCLGVACRIAMENEVPMSTYTNSNGGVVFGDATGTLPNEVMEFFGFPVPDPLLRRVSPFADESCPMFAESTAVTMNDNYKDSFAVIADAFERTYVTPPVEKNE